MPVEVQHVSHHCDRHLREMVSNGLNSCVKKIQMTMAVPMVRSWEIPSVCGHLDLHLTDQ